MKVVFWLGDDFMFGLVGIAAGDWPEKNRAGPGWLPRMLRQL